MENLEYNKENILKKFSEYMEIYFSITDAIGKTIEYFLDLENKQVSHYYDIYHIYGICFKNSVKISNQVAKKYIKTFKNKDII